MKIGIDIGYGYVKAISDAGQKTSFPAIIAPSGNGLGLGDVLNSLQNLSGSRLAPG